MTSIFSTISSNTKKLLLRSATLSKEAAKYVGSKALQFAPINEKQVVGREDAQSKSLLDNLIHKGKTTSLEMLRLKFSPNNKVLLINEDGQTFDARYIINKAIEYDNTKVLDYILKQLGPGIFIQNKHNPWKMSVEHGNLKTLKWLDTNVNNLALKDPAKGHSMMELAIKNHDYKIAEYFKKSENNLEKEIQKLTTLENNLQNEIEKYRQKIDSKKVKGKALLELEYQKNLKSAQLQDVQSEIKTVEEIASNKMSEMKDNVGNNLMHQACTRGDLDALKWITKNLSNIQPDETNNDGESPAHLAVKNGHMHILQHLATEKMLDFTAINLKNENIAHLAMKNFLEENHKDTSNITWLLKMAPDLFVESSYNTLSPLEMAYNQKHYDICIMICKQYPAVSQSEAFTSIQNDLVAKNLLSQVEQGASHDTLNKVLELLNHAVAEQKDLSHLNEQEIQYTAAEHLKLAEDLKPIDPYHNAKNLAGFNEQAPHSNAEGGIFNAEHNNPQKTMNE